MNRNNQVFDLTADDEVREIRRHPALRNHQQNDDIAVTGFRPAPLVYRQIPAPSYNQFYGKQNQNTNPKKATARSQQFRPQQHGKKPPLHQQKQNRNAPFFDVPRRSNQPSSSQRPIAPKPAQLTKSKVHKPADPSALHFYVIPPPPPEIENLHNTQLFTSLVDLFKVQGHFLARAKHVLFIDLDNYAVFKKMKRSIPDDCFVYIFAGPRVCGHPSAIRASLQVSEEQLRKLNHYFASPTLDINFFDKNKTASDPNNPAIVFDSDEEMEPLTVEDSDTEEGEEEPQADKGAGSGVEEEQKDSERQEGEVAEEESMNGEFSDSVISTVVEEEQSPPPPSFHEFFKDRQQQQQSPPPPPPSASLARPSSPLPAPPSLFPLPSSHPTLPPQDSAFKQQLTVRPLRDITSLLPPKQKLIPPKPVPKMTKDELRQWNYFCRKHREKEELEFRQKEQEASKKRTPVASSSSSSSSSSAVVPQNPLLFLSPYQASAVEGIVETCKSAKDVLTQVKNLRTLQEYFKLHADALEAMPLSEVDLSKKRKRERSRSMIMTSLQPSKTAQQPQQQQQEMEQAKYADVEIDLEANEEGEGEVQMDARLPVEDDSASSSAAEPQIAQEIDVPPSKRSKNDDQETPQANPDEASYEAIELDECEEGDDISEEDDEGEEEEEEEEESSSDSEGQSQGEISAKKQKKKDDKLREKKAKKMERKKRKAEIKKMREEQPSITNALWQGNMYTKGDKNRERKSIAQEVQEQKEAGIHSSAYSHFKPLISASSSSSLAASSNPYQSLSDEPAPPAPPPKSSSSSSSSPVSAAAAASSSTVLPAYIKQEGTICAPQELWDQQPRPRFVNKSAVLTLLWRGMITMRPAGASKDAADFALVMCFGTLDSKLPPDVSFTIVTGDKGMLEALRHVNPDRKARVVNPHQEDINEMKLKY